MLTKLATFRGVSPAGEPLVRLFEPQYGLIKEAGSLMPQIRQWMSAYKPDSGKIAVLVNAMGASEYWGQNVNGDIFPEAALIHDCRNHKEQAHPYDDHTGKIIPVYGYWTFLNAFPFVHHRNKDPSRAFGHVALAVWNPRMHRVELIVIIDKALAMQHGAQDVVDRILAGEFPDVSMGCRVPYDVCTICGNRSKTRNDYCTCIKEIGMGRILDDGRRIGVINCHPRFFDISFVFIGADKTAKVMCKLASGIIVPQSIADAELLYGVETEGPSEGLLKAASVATGDVEDARFPDTKSVRKKLDEEVVNRVLGRSEAGVTVSDKTDDAENKTAGLKDLKVLKDLFAGSTLKHLKGRVGKRSIRVDNLLKKASDRIDPTDEADTRLLMGRIDDQESPTVIGDGLLRTNLGTRDDEESMAVARRGMDADTEPSIDLGSGFSSPNTQSRKQQIYDFYTRKNHGEALPPPGGVEQRAKVMGFYSNKSSPSNTWVGNVADDANLSKESFDLEKAKKNLVDRRTGLSETFERAKSIKIGPAPSPNRKDHPFVGTIEFRGLTIHVENKPGSVREGKNWQTEMKLPYGEILSTRGTDGDKLDVYVGPWRDAENAFIIHQNRVGGPRDGKYDEDKVMLGFDSAEQAKAAYLAHYDNPAFFRSITAMAFPLFKKAIVSKEAHGEKLASAWSDVVADMLMADEFQTKTKHAWRSFGTWEEAVRAAEIINANIPIDWMDVLGFFPRQDEMSGEFILSHRPLSSERMREVFGMDKQAAELEDLFAGAGTAMRRQRTWRDKVTGRETNVAGSGFESSDKAKTASVEPQSVSIETVKVARVLHDGWSPEDILKVSNETKAAAHLKWADIVKRIGPSKAVGRVTPLLSQTEPDLPVEVLNKLGGEKDLKKSLATPALMGMALKPHEFQRIILIHIGKSDVADKMDEEGKVFKPSEEGAPPCEELGPEHFDDHLLQTLLPFLEGKSYTGPVVRRRIVRIIMTKPSSHPAQTEVDSPLLSKVASAYTWYRREIMKLARALPATVTSHPELHARTLGVSTEDLFNKTAAGELGLDRRSLGILLGTVPLSLLYSAHKRQQMERGEDVGLLGTLVADHPWLTSMGVVTGLGALLRDPRAQQAVDEAFAAGHRIWDGKQAPVSA